MTAIGLLLRLKYRIQRATSCVIVSAALGMLRGAFILNSNDVLHNKAVAKICRFSSYLQNLSWKILGAARKTRKRFEGLENVW